jgi:P-type Ca2+ transporter type 2C
MRDRFSASQPARGSDDLGEAKLNTATSAHTWTPDEALDRLSSEPSGLSDAEARRRLREHGPNALPAAKPRSAWLILADQLRSVVVLLLCAAAAVAVITGDLTDAAAIGVVLLINTTLGFVTELRARRAMESLVRLQAPRAVVLREGHPREIDARELVPGDVIKLEAGQFAPADARLLESSDLRTIEAALTGESLPVMKTVDPVAADTPLPDRSNMLYQGTTVAHGTTRAVVVATGAQTALGRIGELTASVRQERTPLERRLDALGHRLVWLALGTGAAVSTLTALRGLPVGQMIETGIALAIAAVPEGLPAVATTALAVGVHRMARRHALIRRLASAETLGSVTVICTDKTGTLTAGAMAVTVLSLGDREITITGNGYERTGTFLEGQRDLDAAKDAQAREALTIGMLANHAELVEDGDGAAVLGDPTEAALLVAGARAGLDRDRLLEEHPQVGEVPFSSTRMLMATFHQTDRDFTVYVKGAPGRVIEQCDRLLSAGGETPLDDAERERLLDRNHGLAARGLRVLALARGRATRMDETALRHLTFVGFAGLMDPPAIGVKDTIRVFREAGIRTVMLTGDQQLTAQAVATDLGILREGEQVLDGRAVAQLSEDALAEQAGSIAAFSRVDPEAKLAIVRAFKRRGDIVAVLGDGVNDAPALRQADVGVAMGQRGTDVAKEAADVVLLDDRFSTIGVAVEQGRVIFDNIRKFVFYLFSCNLAEVLILLVAALVGLPLPLLPLQILWLNIVTDTFPALSLAIEPADRGVMQRRPRDPDEAIFSAGFLRAIAWYALLITAVTLGAFWFALQASEGTASPRALTMSFMTLALAQTFHLGNARSEEHVLSMRQIVSNPIALGAVALVVLLQVLAVHFRPLAEVLRTEPLGAGDWIVCLSLALVPAVIGQATRWLSAKRSSGVA